jgi:hypothetical protein
MNRKHLGIVAETALRRILVSKGYQASRNAASHGLFDVLAFGAGVVLVIEVKSTAANKLYLTKTSGQIEKLMLMSATCTRAGPNVMGIVAVYWGQLDAFELYAVEDCLVNPVLKPGEGIDLRDIDDGSCATPPKNSSPSVGSPCPPACADKLNNYAVQVAEELGKLQDPDVED